MLVEIKIQGVWYRFTTSWWSDGTREFTCISEEPTDAIKGKRFIKEQIRSAISRGTFRII